jgi:hypothetical protein
MPITHKKDGWYWGSRGPFETKKKAEEVRTAAYSSGYVKKSWQEILKKEKDACYYKVKSRYKEWPSAYGSGALVQCRKVGAKNWGNSVEKGGDNFAREKKEGLHGWFSRRGGSGKAKGWISCQSCEDDKEGTESCGREDASKGTKQRCRPTCAACKTYKRRKGV